MITDEESKTAFGSRIPLGRVAQAEQVARLALYLASDESDHSTGSEFVVDGGITAGFGFAP
jgi:3alpha(or 20beta)-hydroxysteroid dehydrogenase